MLASVRKTNRLVTAHEAVISGGFGAEIAARVADAAIWHLGAPQTGGTAVSQRRSPSALVCGQPTWRERPPTHIRRTPRRRVTMK
ncbi:MAG TPA: transketolase C-terminal domain-containing protein [Mycobacterium sp.]|nr:transketolase C-terminal domain-containing protein [Mycobacterium sp.]